MSHLKLGCHQIVDSRVGTWDPYIYINEYMNSLNIREMMTHQNKIVYFFSPSLSGTH